MIQSGTPDYDVVIVGAGPTGLACGIELKKLGFRVVLLDKGCVVNSLYHYPTNMVFFTTPELLEIGNIPMTSLNEKPGRTEALKYYRRVAAHYELDIRQYQHVDSVEGENNHFVTHAHGINQEPFTYSSRKVILSTGFYDVPNLLNIPGEDLPKVIHYYKEPHPYYNQDVVVVGAKNSAAIVALELWWCGARVTLVHRGGELHKNIKYWIMPNISNRIKNGEIPAYFNSTVTAITPGTVELQTPNGPVSLKNDFVFALTGYRPDFPFLAKCGVALNETTQRPDLDSDTLESARKGLFLAGVIVAGVHTSEIFIENGRFHGNQIAAAIASQLKG